MKNQFIISFLVILFLALATTGVILYGRGYRLGYNGKPDFFGTGLLVVNSNPDGAGVKINDHLTTATNNTINLPPGEYDVKIEKDGYFPWEKKIKVEKEVVSKADALLFSTRPNLESITDKGVSNPVIDPSFTKIAFVASPSATDSKKNGIFVLDIASRPILTLQSSSTQIADNTSDAFSTATLSWSPDGKSILATISGNRRNPTSYLLNATTLNTTPQDVTETLPTVIGSWEKDTLAKQNAQLQALKSSLKKLVNDNFSILAWSQDETKILYQASASATLPLVINPPLIGTDTTPQQRTVEKNGVYVYDLKEDKNFKILNPQDAQLHTADAQLPIQWLPDNKHVVFTHDKKIDIMDYDGQNKTTVYAGPFVDHYVFPWPDSSRIVILTNLGNDQILPNLYTISLK